MTSSKKPDPPNPPRAPTAQDIVAISASLRQIHAQIRLITAARFAGFVELSRSEQRDALLALQASSEAAIDLLDHITPAE